jgi:5'-nucleotidase
MRALITNDDDVQSHGLNTLTRVAVAAGLDVTVAAPHEERSGSSAALSALEENGRLLVSDHPLEGLGGVSVLAVHASPAMIVFAAARGAFGDPPDVVLSGINHGPNRVRQSCTPERSVPR